MSKYYWGNREAKNNWLKPKQLDKQIPYADAKEFSYVFHKICKGTEQIQRSNMKKGLNFRTFDSQREYFSAYEQAIKLISVPYQEKYIETTFGDSHVVCCGDENNLPLVLLHASSCGSPIWYKNIAFLSRYFKVYAIDLIGEALKVFLPRK